MRSELVQWSPDRQLDSLQSEMNRVFDSFFGNSNGHSRRWIPSMDLMEMEDSFVLKADLPGMDKDAVRIEVHANTLTISGERREERDEKREGYHRVERSFGSFSRSVSLGEGVRAEDIQASFKDGVLEVTIPKAQAEEAKQIQIKSE